VRLSPTCAFIFARARVYISAGVFALLVVRPALAASLNDIAISTSAAALANSSDANIRAAAALELARRHAVDQVPALAARLSAEKVPQVRQSIAIALSNLGLPAFDALVQALSDGSPVIREEAASGLGRIGDAGAQSALLDQLKREKDPAVAQVLVFWLGGLKNDAASDTVAQALKSPNPNLRAEAAHALGRIGTDKAKDHLRKAAKDPDKNVQSVIDANKD
jgi:HEAT repeat protein